MANTRTKELTPIEILDTNFNRKYALSVASPNNNLNQLEHILCETTLFDNIQYLFQKSSELVNSIRLYPFNVRNFMVMVDEALTTRYIPIGRVSGGIGGTELVGRASKGVKNNVLISTIVIPPGTKFYQFEPYTKMKIFLPYLGYFDLPVNELRYAYTTTGITLTIRYSVDFDTGMLTAYVYNDDEGYLILTATGKIGVDIPIGSTNANEVATNILSSSLKIVGGSLITLASGGTATPVGAVVTASGVKSAFSGAVDLATHSVTHYTNGGLNGGSSNMASPNKCYVEILEPIPNIQTNNDIEKYAHTYGRPLQQSRDLDTLTGFTKVGEVHLDGFDEATLPEIEEIESLLKSGVIL